MKIEVTNQSFGVKALLNGFSTEEVQRKIEACQNGQCECDCDPQMMEKIEAIECTHSEDGTVVNITGNVDAQALAPMMRECLLGTTPQIQE